MSKTLAIVALLLSLLLAPAPAQVTGADAPTTATLPAGAFRIGFVDVELVLDQSIAIRRVLDEVDKELAGQAKQIDDAKREYRTLQLRMDQRGLIVNDEERARMRNQMDTLQRQLDEMEFRFERMIRDRQRTTIEPVLDQVIQMIADYGAREGYDMILRGEVVLYGRERADITAHILAEIDSRSDELLAAIRAGAASSAPVAPPRGDDAEPLPMVP